MIQCQDQVKYSNLEKTTGDGPRNASVLTVLDVCNTPKVVQGLQHAATRQMPPPAAIVANVDFPLACTVSSATHCFRVRWEGHHALIDTDNPRFADPSFQGMSAPIGFPAICSVMAAVKARYIDADAQDLGSLFVENIQSIERRYVTQDHPFRKLKVPHHNLAPLRH